MKHLKLTSLFILIAFSFFAHGQIVNSTTTSNAEDSEDYDLTDKERIESKTYIHQGLSQRTMQEACAKLDDPSACHGNGKTKFLGLDSDLIKAISKMYSLFSGMMGIAGGGIEVRVKDGKEGTKKGVEKSKDTAANTAGESGDTAANATEGAKKSAEESAEKTEEATDYCAMIPAAGEVVASTMQALGDEDIVNEEAQQSQQKAQLYKAARTHRTRQKTAQIQGATWGATSACYASYLAFGGAVLNYKTILKAGAAAFLTGFWFYESHQQNKYADQINNIAQQLPGKGDCNPHTENNCYCSQKETQYDTRYCLETLKKKIANTNSYSVPCVTAGLKSDANCTCIKAERCFDSKFFSNISGTGLEAFGTSAAGKSFRSLTNGVLSNGKLSSSANSSSAGARKLLGDLDSKITDIPNLNKSQRNQVNALKKFGMPRKIASLMASQKANSYGKSKVANLGKGNSQYAKIASKTRKNSSSGSGKILSFGGAKGAIGNSKRKKSGSNFSSLLNRFKKKKTSGNSKGKVLKFAHKASQRAQITRNKGRPLFEIISRRYQVSGWKKLSIE